MRLIASSLHNTTDSFRSQTDWQEPVWRQGKMKGMNLFSTISIYSNIMTSQSWVSFPLDLYQSEHVRWVKKHGRAHISLRTCSFVFISNHLQQDEGRRTHHEAIPASMPRQASYPTAGRETESSPSDQAYHSSQDHTSTGPRIMGSWHHRTTTS